MSLELAIKELTEEVKALRETLSKKVEVKPEPKVEVKPEPKVEVKSEPTVEPKVEVKPEPKVEPKMEVKMTLRDVQKELVKVMEMKGEEVAMSILSETGNAFTLVDLKEDKFHNVIKACKEAIGE